MSRESCINHRTKERFVQLREDYVGMIAAYKPGQEKDYCAAAVLSLIEYWANGKLAENSELGDRIPLGTRKAADWTSGVIGLYSSKRVMERVRMLVELKFLEMQEATGTAPQYWANIDIIQHALDLYVSGLDPRQMSTPAKSPQTNVYPTPDKCLDPPDKCLGEPQTNVYLSIYKNDQKESLQESVRSDTNTEGDRSVEILEAEVEVAENQSSTVPDLNDLWQENKTDPVDQNSAAPCDNKPVKYNGLTLAQVETLQDKYDSGEVTDLPRKEKIALALYLMPEVNLYRKSGRILQSTPNDIDPAFLKFFAFDQWQGSSDVNKARNTIVSYEEKMNYWGTLISVAKKWEEFKANPEAGYQELKADAYERMKRKQATDVDVKLISVELSAQFQQHNSRQQPLETMDQKTRERWEAYQTVLRLQEVSRAGVASQNPA